MKCPICDSIDITYKVAEITGVWPKCHNVSFCNHCGLYYLSDNPTEAEIRNLYAIRYYSSPSSRLKDTAKTLFRYFRCRSQRDHIMRILKTQEIRVIEVGCADGMLLHQFRQTGCSVYGTEYSHKMHKIAKNRYQIAVDDTDFFDLHGEYDLLVMSHVLEHFTDPYGVLQHARNLLANQGTIFVEVPYSPLPTECTEWELTNYLNTTHIYNFRLDNLQRLFKDCGYTVKSTIRIFYNLPTFVGKSSRREIGNHLMRGSLPKFQHLGALSYYLVKSIIMPHHAYKSMSLQEGWCGVGDCIRLIAVKDS